MVGSSILDIRLDHDVNALYIQFHSGRVARTVEVTDSVYIDMDAKDEPLGLEIINAVEFIFRGNVPPRPAHRERGLGGEGQLSRRQ
jgi:uncharacterized protein YuzE